MNTIITKLQSILKQFWLKPIPIQINNARPEGRGNFRGNFNIKTLYRTTINE